MGSGEIGLKEYLQAFPTILGESAKGLRSRLTEIENPEKEANKNAYLNLQAQGSVMPEYAKNYQGDTTEKDAIDQAMNFAQMPGTWVKAANPAVRGAFSSLIDHVARQEISDAGATIKELPKTFTTKRMGDVIDHPELFAADPSLKDITVSRAGTQPGENASYSPGQGEYMNRETIRLNPDLPNPLSQIIHELNHASQNRMAGSAQGANAFSSTAQYMKNDVLPLFLKQQELEKELLNQSAYSPKWVEINNQIQDISKQLDSKNPAKAYTNSAGEAEARAAQARQGMSMEQRYATQPYESQNIGLKDYIVNRGR